MDNIIKFIEILPEIISYIIYGVVFLSIYNFTTYKNEVQKTKSYLISCVTISFIIKICFDGIIALVNEWLKKELVNNGTRYYIGIILFTVLTAYFSGKIVTSNWFKTFLLKIKIERTPNKNIWDDIIRKNTWLYVHIKNKDYACLGELQYVEENCSNPKIVLSNYQLIKMSTAETKKDYSNDSNKKILLDTSNIEIIEIIYNNKQKNKQTKHQKRKN